MMTAWRSLLALALVATAVAGCGKKSDAPAGDPAYLLGERPADALSVAAARGTSGDTPLVVVGRIGGSEKPFVDNLAAFTLVDAALKPCPKEEGCPTPWDYCCDTSKLKQNMATIMVVDAQGNTLSKDARQLLGVKELTTVVARGKPQRDADGNLTVLVEKVFVVKE